MWAIFMLSKQVRHASFPSGFTFHPLSARFIFSHKQLCDFRIYERKLLYKLFCPAFKLFMMLVTTGVYKQWGSKNENERHDASCVHF